MALRGDRGDRFLIGSARKWPPSSLRIVEANGRPALVTRFDGSLDNVITFDVRDERVAALYIARNPDKLATFGQSGRAPEDSGGA